MAKQAKRASPILGTAAALIGDAADTLVGRDSRFHHTFEAPLDAVRPDPDQPRKTFEESEIAALAGTMAERGQLQPILVRRDPKVRTGWLIVAGERRWRAARQAGWSAILAIEHDADPAVASLVENLQRVDLTPVEEARGVQRLIETKGWTQSTAAVALGKSKAEVSALLRILTLPESLLKTVLTSEHHLPKNVLIELARVENPGARSRLVRMAADGTLTIRAIRLVDGEVDSPAPDVKSVPRTEPRGIGLRLFDRLAKQLRLQRTAGVKLRNAEREHLKLLREEIDLRLKNE